AAGPPRGRTPTGAGKAPSGAEWDRDQVLPPGVQEGGRVRVAEELGREEELRVEGLADQPQPRLLQRAVSLEQVAAQARRHHVRPGRGAAARARHHVVDRELLDAPRAVLAGVAVAPQDVLLVERHPLEERLAD